MPFHELPSEAWEILAKYDSPPGLVAHLTLVHDVAVTLIQMLNVCWPQLAYEQDDVLIGAAIHDIGKTVCPYELTGPGKQHEEIGPRLLLASGLPEARARFARTHARWQQEPNVQLEDLLVAFADTIWKGKRDEALEQAIADQIAQHCREEPWQAYMRLDDIACELAKDAHARILWQATYTC